MVLTFVPYEALEQKIITSAQSGGYDVVLSDGPFTAKFAQAKIVRELPKLSAADLKDIFPGAIEGGMYKGKFYGMPWLNDCKYLFYNKKMLKEAGFSAPPKTWDELVTQAKAIKAKGLGAVPDRLELVPGRVPDLRLHHAHLRFRRRHVRQEGPASIHRRGQPESPRFHGQQHQGRHLQSEIDRMGRGRCPRRLLRRERRLLLELDLCLQRRQGSRAIEDRRRCRHRRHPRHRGASSAPR